MGFFEVFLFLLLMFSFDEAFEKIKENLEGSTPRAKKCHIEVSSNIEIIKAKNPNEREKRKQKNRRKLRKFKFKENNRKSRNQQR